MLHRHPDIAGQGIVDKLKGEIVRHHPSHQQAPESPIYLRRKTAQFFDAQSALLAHRAQFGWFDKVAQFMQARRRVPRP